MLLQIREQQPTHIAPWLDTEVPTFRAEQYAEYKAGATKPPTNSTDKSI